MGLKKIQLVAQIVGFVTIGLLSISGVLAITSDGSPAWAALGQASPSMSARVPNVINYQGMLRRPDGSVINGTYDMTFRLYYLPKGGNVVHTEQLLNVVVRDGLFTVLLGDGDGNPIQAADFKDPLYVGIQVGNDAEMQPRQRIAPVPYAVQLTDGVYVDESGNVGIGTTSPQAKLHVADESSPASITLGANGSYGGHTQLSVRLDNVKGGNAIIQAVKSSGFAYGNLLLNPAGGDVGIGKEPGEELDVNGDIAWTGDLKSMVVSDLYSVSRHNEAGFLCTDMSSVTSSVCFLTEVVMEDIDAGGENAGCRILQSGGTWRLCAQLGETDDADVWCAAYCLQW
jgi:hypothetical protein